VDDDLDRVRAWGYDVGQWSALGPLDRVVLRHRGSDVAQICRRLASARAELGPEIELLSQLDCWSPAGFRDVRSLRQALAAVREAGAGAAGRHRVGVYRADAVAALGIWDALA
jgi:hypothetical protein